MTTGKLQDIPIPSSAPDKPPSELSIAFSRLVSPEPPTSAQPVLSPRTKKFLAVAVAVAATAAAVLFQENEDGQTALSEIRRTLGKASRAVDRFLEAAEKTLEPSEPALQPAALEGPANVIVATPDMIIDEDEDQATGAGEGGQTILAWLSKLWRTLVEAWSASASTASQVMGRIEAAERALELSGPALQPAALEGP